MISRYPDRRQSLYWRLVVFVALGLYGLLALSVVRFVVLNPLLAAAFYVTIIALAYAAWLVISGTGRRRTVGYGLAALGGVLLLLELSAFADSSSRRGLVVFAVLAAAYAVILSVLRNTYWRERRQAGAIAGRPAFKHPYLIINPKSGNGRAVKAHVDRLARTQGIDVLFTEPGKDVAQTALEAVNGGADVIGISGGDGSIGAVAKVAIDHGLPIVVLPGGTRCHFARDLGMDPERIADALAGFTGVERRIDVGSINGRVFLNNASFGLYADIVAHPEYRERKLEVARGVLREIAAGRKPPYSLRFRLGGRQFDNAVQVLVGVNRYDTFNMFEPLRREQLDGGILQVTVVTELTDVLMRHLLRGAATRRLSKVQGLFQDDVESLTIGADGGELIAGVDGENEIYTAPVELRIMPGALRVYVPAEGVRTRPIKTFSPVMLRNMWRAGAQR